MTEVDGALRSTMRPDQYGEGYFEHGDGSNYVRYGDDPGWGPTVAALARFVPPGPSAPFTVHTPLLEIACAKGYFVHMARQFGYNAYGVDLSRWAIEHALPAAKPYVRQGNAVDLPYEDDSFAIVCSWEFFEHVPETELDWVGSEMLRVAAPGALMVHRIGTLESEADLSDHLHDRTHVTNHTSAWWRNRLYDWPLRPRPDVEQALNDAFAGRDWAGRFFAYDVDQAV